MQDLIPVIDNASARGKAVHDTVTRVAICIVDNVAWESVFWAVVNVVAEGIDCSGASFASRQRGEKKGEA